MAKHGRNRRPPHRAATRASHPTHQQSHRGDRPEDQPLIASLRKALREPDPTVFLHEVSTIVEALNRNAASATSPGGADLPPDHAGPVLGDIADSFLDVDIAETTAALYVISALVLDELLAARISTVLATRRQPMPPAVVGVRGLTVTDAVFMTHELGDGDDIVLGLTWPDGSQATFLCYVDHNMGTIVKDAFLVGQTVDDVVGRLTDITIEHRTKTAFDHIPLADARALLAEAVESGLVLHPDWQTDTWPGCRPLLQMLVRGMPRGGRGWDERETPWDELYEGDSEDAALELAYAFLYSPEGKALGGDGGLDRAAAQYLADYVLEELHGVPRWSPVTVELALMQYFGIAVAEPPELLARVPDVLRAYIRYAHRVGSITTTSTTETLEAVDRWVPLYLELVHDPEAQERRLLVHDFVVEEAAKATNWLSLLEQVGGEKALAALNDDPLPDEDIDWSSIPDDVHDRVREVAELLDRFSEESFPEGTGVEFRTAGRRFLSRVAAADPTIFRRRSRAATAAAAVAWVVAKANGIVGYGAPMRSDSLHAWFGLKGSSSQRAQLMLQAIGVHRDDLFGEMCLGSPGYLISSYRRTLLEVRDELRDREPQE